MFFTFTIAAYWVFEKERAQELVARPGQARATEAHRDTWDLIDAKLGAYVRGQLLMITFVSTVLSFAFWLIGCRYWLLIGVFAGIVEIVPVIGPFAAGLGRDRRRADRLLADGDRGRVAVSACGCSRTTSSGRTCSATPSALSPLIVLVTVT